MKIALLDPNPRVGHVATWIAHTTAALRAAGHTVDTVSSTKSGRASTGWGTARWGTAWSPYRPDVVVKDAELASTLDGYDRVVLTDAAQDGLDAAAVKAGEKPVYVDALGELLDSWTAVLHPGGDYGSAGAPFLADLLADDRSRHGTLLVHGDAMLPAVENLETVRASLPYTGGTDPDAPVPSGEVIGATGVLTAAHQVAAAAVHLPADTTVELWGASETGKRANTSYAILESLLPYAVGVERRAGQEDPPPPNEPHGAKETPFTWDARVRSGALVRYLGNYVDAPGTAARHAIHAAASWLSDDGLAADYPTLEALDAGSVCLLQGASTHLKALFLDEWTPNGERLLADPEATAEALTKLLRALPNEGWRASTAAANRRAVAQLHDPRAVVDALTS